MKQLTRSKPTMPAKPNGQESDLRAGELLNRDSLRISVNNLLFFAPTTLSDALAFKQTHPGSAVIAGATELGVFRNKRGIVPTAILSLRRIPELDILKCGAGSIEIGANVTWAQLEPVLNQKLPAFRRIVERFGSPQIRHVATLVGNIAHGSPIADSLPLLCVMDAQLEIRSSRGVRHCSINRFYTGYQQKDLQPDELITKVLLPLPKPDERIRFYKISRRTDLDISTFCAAIRITTDGASISSANIAFGGVAPTVVRLSQTETFLSEKPWSESTFRQAGAIARNEVTPITDVRGSARFRGQLCANVLSRFYFDEADSVMEAEA